MDKESVLRGIVDCGVVAVVRAESADLALRAVEAVVEGGVNAVEITMTVPGAVEVIRQLAASLPEGAILGAGTVLSAEDAKRCIDAGASFIVSPNTNPAAIAAAKECGVACMPGALTPTEVYTAWTAGADIVKLFPGNVVGPSYIKDLHGPFPQIPLMPTGGVDLETARGWLEAGAVALGVGGALVDRKLLSSGDFEEITSRARRFREIVVGFRG